MRVLIAGGEKVDRIQAVLSDIFRDGEIELMCCQNVQDIEDYQTAGEYYDRLIVMDNAFGQGGTTEEELRQQIRRVVNVITKAGKHGETVFIMRFPEACELVKENCFGLDLPLRVVLFKGNAYKVAFFREMCTQDLCDIQDVYEADASTKLAQSTVEVETSTEVETSGETREYDSDYGTFDAPEDMQPNAFDSFDYESNGDDADLYWYEDNDVDERDLPTSSNEDLGLDTEISYPTANARESTLETDDADIMPDYSEQDTMYSRRDSFETDPDADSGDSVESTRFDIYGEEETEEASGLTDESIYDSVATTPLEEETEIVDPSVESYYAPPAPPSTPKSVEPVQPQKSVGGLGRLFGGAKKPTPPIQQPVAPPTRVPKQAMPTDNAQSDTLMPGDKRTQAKVRELKGVLDKMAIRGTSIFCTGVAGSGVSTTAYNIAALLAKWGYMVCIVDLDMYGRAQAYVTLDSFEAVHCEDSGSSALMRTVKEPTSAERNSAIIGSGLRTLTTGLNAPYRKTEALIDSGALTKFVSIMRTTYQFVVYDMPFSLLNGSLGDILYTADIITLIAEDNTHGLMSAMLQLGNLPGTDLQGLLFGRAKLLLNKSTGHNVYFGKHVSRVQKALLLLDSVVESMVGVKSDYPFAGMRMTHRIPYVAEFDDAWLTKKPIAYTSAGGAIFTQLLSDLVLSN